MSTNNAPDTPFAKILKDTEAELSTMLPSVRQRILNRVRAAYWIGVNDMQELDAGLADRRESPRNASTPIGERQTQANRTISS